MESTFERSFDKIDLIFIITISIYIVALFLFISIFIIKYFDLDKEDKNKNTISNKKDDIKEKKQSSNKFVNIVKEKIILIKNKASLLSNSLKNSHRNKDKNKKLKTNDNQIIKNNYIKPKNQINNNINYKSINHKKKNNKRANKTSRKNYKNNFSYVKNNPKKK